MSPFQKRVRGWMSILLAVLVVFGLSAHSASAATLSAVDFESGDLSGTSYAKNATVTSTGALDGLYSMYTGTGAHAEFGGVSVSDDYFATLFEALSAPTATRTILAFKAYNANASIDTTDSNGYSFVIDTTNHIKLKLGASSVGTCPLTFNTSTLYRIGISFHVTNPSATGTISAYCAAGNTNFGTPFYQNTADDKTHWSNEVGLWLGATGTTTPADYLYDNVQEDNTTIPAAFTSPATRIGNKATFENGNPTAGNGFNSVSTTAPSMIYTSPLHSVYSAQISNANTNQYGVIGSSGSHAEAYVSFLYRLDATVTQVTPLMFVGPTGATNEVKLSVGTDNKIRMVYEGVSAANYSPALTVGTTYRVGLHIKEDTVAGTTLVESFLATGNTAFGTAFNTSTEPKAFSADEPFTFGSTSKALSSTYDDIQVDSAVMPPTIP